MQPAAAQSDPALTQGAIIGIGVGIGLGVGIPAVLAVIWILYFYCSHQSPPITALAREEDLVYTLPAKDTVCVPMPSTTVLAEDASAAIGVSGAAGPPVHHHRASTFSSPESNRQVAALANSTMYASRDVRSAVKLGQVGRGRRLSEVGVASKSTVLPASVGEDRDAKDASEPPAPPPPKADASAPDSDEDRPVTGVPPEKISIEFKPQEGAVLTAAAKKHHIAQLHKVDSAGEDVTMFQQPPELRHMLAQKSSSRGPSPKASPAPYAGSPGGDKLDKTAGGVGPGGIPRPSTGARAADSI